MKLLIDCRECNNYKFEKVGENKYRATCLLGKSRAVECSYSESINKNNRRNGVKGLNVDCDFFESINPLYEEEDDEMNITTIEEAINDYRIADEEHKRKLKTLENFHKTDREVLEAVIRKNFNLPDDGIIEIKDNHVEIYFKDGISHDVFSKLENTGIVYTVFTADSLWDSHCVLWIQF